MARNDQDIVVAVYSIHGHGDLSSPALLGQTKENIMRLRANGNGKYITYVESLMA
jgi:hypothetical protein